MALQDTIRFLIYVFVALSLTRGCSEKCWSSQDVLEHGSNNRKSDLCSVKQTWLAEHLSIYILERTEISSLKHGSENTDFYLLPKLLAHKLSNKVSLANMANGKLEHLFYQEVGSRNSESYLDWNIKLLEVIFKQLSLVGLYCLIAHQSTLKEIVHDVKRAVTRKHVLHSKEDLLIILQTLLSIFIREMCPPVSGLDEDKCEEEDLYLKDGKTKSWLYDPFGWPGRFTEFFSFSVFDRIASYRELSSSNLTADVTSFLNLADAGFRYSGEGSILECQGCRNSVDIKNFDSPATDAKYHKAVCSYVKNDGQVTSKIMDSEKQEEVETDSVPPTQDEYVLLNEHNEQLSTFNSSTSIGTQEIPTGNKNDLSNQMPNEMSNHVAQLDNNVICPEVTQSWEPQTASSEGDNPELPGSTNQQAVQAIFPAHQLTDETPDPTQRHINQAASLTEQQGGHVAAAKPQHPNQLPTRHYEELAASAAPDRSTPFSTSAASKSNDQLFDSVEFEAEHDGSKHLYNELIETCQKNPGHYTNFPMWSLQLDCIPSNISNHDVLNLINLFGKLVVRLVVSTTSRNRPDAKLKAESKYTFGTGMAIDKEDTPYTEHEGKWNTMKKYLAKNKGYIYIETNRHVIYDDTEAQSTVAEFFYDNPNRRGVIKAKGVSIEHSQTLGDFKSILKCKISDLSIVEFVKNTHHEIRTLTGRLDQKLKERLMKRVFIISHPHGREKVLTYGEFVMVKYQLKTEHPLTKLVKINKHTQISQNSEDIRKVIFYTADTCKGASGAVVISFKRTMNNGTEDIVMDLWMHSGVCKQHGLSASAMKELTPEDVRNHGQTTTVRSSIQDDHANDPDSPANQVVSCPVYTVMGSPTHPAYAAYANRLESYPQSFSHVHSACELADGGFFYAGYDDCVRCFHCGLGLRSWRPGDSIYEEHNKNRPDCQFLRMKLRASGINQLGFQSHDQRRGTHTTGAQIPAQNQTNSGPRNNNEQHGQPKLSQLNQKSVAQETETHTDSNFQAETVLQNHTSLTNNQQEGSPNSQDNIAVAVLETEQKYLKQLLICKVCFKNQVKDLFLPCGELVACLECSKLLTHCPSCNKKILATITTFFS